MSPLAQHDPYAQPWYMAWQTTMEAHPTSESRPLAVCFTCPQGALWLQGNCRQLPTQFGVAGADFTSVYGYGGPLIVGNPQAVWQAFEPEWQALAQSLAIVAECQRFHPLLTNHVGAPPPYRVEAIKPVVSVALQGSLDDVLARMHPNKRADIKLATRKGVVVRQDNANPQALQAFWSVYQAHMRYQQAGAFYQFSPSVLPHWAQALANGTMHLFNAYDQATGQYLGGLLALSSARITHYFLAASTPQGKQQQAPVACLWAAIQHAWQQGCHVFHLGGGLTGGALAPQDSLFRFKQYFAPTNTAMYQLGLRVHDNERYEALQAAYQYLNGQAPPPNYLLFYRT
jgi:hypothetical protein